MSSSQLHVPPNGEGTSSTSSTFVRPTGHHLRAAASTATKDERDTPAGSTAPRSGPGGIGHALTPEAIDGALSQRVPAFGDSIGDEHRRRHLGALFHREHRGSCELDSVATVHRVVGRRHQRHTRARGQRDPCARSCPATSSVNPFMANFVTSDGIINLCIVSPTGYIRILRTPGLPELADDPRSAMSCSSERLPRVCSSSPGHPQ